MITPHVNINGTSRAELVQQRIDACDYLMDAITALQAVAPNGRDYPGNVDRLLHDRQIHFNRLSALRAMHDELRAEAVQIDRGGKRND